MEQLFDLSIDLIFSEQFSDAKKVLNYALARYPENQRLYIGMGVLYREQDKLGQARNMFEKVLAVAPDNALAKRLLAGLEES